MIFLCNIWHPITGIYCLGSKDFIGFHGQVSHIKNWVKELTRMLENTNKVTQEHGNLILWKRAS
jgi:hypothetical protein